MPALEALQDRLDRAHTLACGLSVDTTYSHAAWASELGGISFPLLADFHPKGSVARRFGVYLQDQGICDRASVVVDASGLVRHASSATPAGQRDMEALVRICEALDAGWPEALPDRPAPIGLPADATLFVKDHCMVSRWALYARNNVHVQDRLPVRNISQDPDAAAEVERLGGKRQAPALLLDGQVLYEGAEIVHTLAERAVGPLC